MTRRLRTPRRDGDDQRSAVRAREMRDWWDWTYVVSRQLARLPAGRLVTRVEAYDVPVLLGQEREL